MEPMRNDKRFDGIPKLMGESNYHPWLASIQTYCQRHSLTPHIDGTAQKPFPPAEQKPELQTTVQEFTYHEKMEHVKDMILYTLSTPVWKKLVPVLKGLE